MPKVGVVFRPQQPPENLRDVVAAVDGSGLDDLWLWEDCFYEGGLTTAAAALSWSDALRVGLGLMPVPLRNPALAAMEIATIARMFPGRFAPAVGHGVLEWMDQVGARVESPMTLLREWTVAVRSLLHGESVSARGRYVALDGVTLDWPPGVVPPVMIGARGPRTLALAGELSDGTILDSANTPDDVRAALAHIAPSAGHEVVVYVQTASDDAKLDRMQAEWPALPTDAVAVGEAERMADMLAGYVEAGADTLVLLPSAEETNMAQFVELASGTRSALRAVLAR
jgi:alkanesulfonate monooxygenase SsuD/methylene tetrahydromethanopterin reductase-like flavin-dependent oxidoreductase (luciferase family)